MPTGGVRDLRRIQIGKELSPSGSGSGPVVPTVQLAGGMTIQEIRNRVFPDEAQGIMSSHRRVYDGSIIANLAYDAGTEGATYEQLIYLLGMGVCGGVSPTNPAIGTYLWTFAPDFANGDNPDTFTIRVGDNWYAWEADGSASRSTHLAAEAQGAWAVTSEIFGRQLAPSTFEVIAFPTPLETILAQMTEFYLDDTGAGIGNTPIPGTLIGWSCDIPGFHEKFFQDGQMTYSEYGLASRALSFSLTFEFNSFAVAEWLDWQAATKRFLRIRATGSGLTAPFTKQATIDACVIWEQPEALGERDGNDIMTFTGRSVFDTAWGKEFELSVQNSILAMP